MSAPAGGPAPAAPGARRRPSRRLVRTVTAVVGCLAVLAAAAVAGARVLRQEPAVTLLANWTGGDARAFREAVIVPFERKHHVRVDYQGSSAESQVLSADVEAGTPPDVVVLTGPGELADYAGQQQLKPLDGLVPRDAFSESWATPVQGHVYWFPLKADLKSIVWYPAGTGERQRRQAARRPDQWCLGMGSGATSGWPGTDWIEDILLQQYGPRTYQAWAGGRLPWRSAQVRRAWTTWGRMVGAGTSPDLVRRALLTEYRDASGLVTAHPRQCTLEHQASFIRARRAWEEVDGRYEPSAHLIPGAAVRDAWEVSGDLVALLHDTPQARELIRHLASAGAQRTWNAKESGFSVHAGAQSTGPDAGWHRSLAATLLDTGAVHCFDASDAMPPPVRDAFAQSAVDFLADPGPSHLDALLQNLDTLRGAKGLVWLRSVCDHGT
ncbi:extracellular solute-binding protein [Streptomyces sp. TG1A-8]|uniref:extracellular solute-binding protein n=1 Tax=Streptomyces sp. TG1A-8 TaxID=3051385 RepID=UPI00265C7F1C|nr:extracellular solute-binding protein [Streptomyces sp. TG1A-8]MDO0925092.1 extracellular solute-binding protein [Streptomyces sp. TG1A-8]